MGLVGNLLAKALFKEGVDQHLLAWVKLTLMLACWTVE